MGVGGVGVSSMSGGADDVRFCLDGDLDDGEGGWSLGADGEGEGEWMRRRF